MRPPARLRLIASAVLALALAWITEMLIPAWKSTILYAAFGSTISVQMLLIGIGGALAILLMNLAGTRVAVMTHSVLTYGFLLVVLCILVALLGNGDAAHLRPLFATTNGKPWWLGAFGIFSFCAYALNGFQTIPQAIEERSGRTNLRTIGMVIIASVAAAAAFYCLVVIAASVATPWQRLVAEPLPMIAAAGTLPRGALVQQVLLIATAVSLLKAWNGVFMMAVRLLVAMARAGYVPASFASLHTRLGSPWRALLFIAALNIAGIFWGKAAIEPITDMCAMVLTLTYVMCCVTVLRLRARSGTARFELPGGRAFIWLGLAGSIVMAIVAFAAPSWRGAGVPLEWQLLAVWGGIGLAVYWLHVRHTVAA